MDTTRQDRRGFLRQMIATTGVATMTGAAGNLMAAGAPKWKDHIGLELYTVRDVLNEKTYEPTLAKLAAMGYKEVEPADYYNHMRPAEYKALLDKYGLKMYSTHADATDGPGLEKELEGQALMGLKYTAIQPAKREREPRPLTVEAVKRSAGQMNKYGAILKKFGMKYYVHNHAGEFELLDDGKTTQYDILLSHTDPALVAMQLDIGWAYMAGQDPIAMFKKTPGRFELWHVKDAKFKHVDPKLSPNAHARASKIVTMGEGDIDYKAVFANAGKAGLKYFVIEQDSAGQGTRSALEDCQIACQNLRKILS